MRRILTVLAGALSIASALPSMGLADNIGRDPDRTDEYVKWWWEPRPHGLLSATWAFVDDSNGPSCNGPRISYGIVGIGDDGDAWLEFWLTHRSSDDLNVTSTGVLLAPISYNYRRLALAWFFDLGFERRHEDGTVLAGLLGVGGEFVVRLQRHWDLSVAAEGFYRTTADFESQVRFGVKFHDKKIAPWGRHA